MKFWAVVTLLLYTGLVNSISDDLKYNNDENINESRKQFLEQNDSISPESLTGTKPDEKLTERRTYDSHDVIKTPRRIDNFGSEKYNVIKKAYPEKNEKSIASTATEEVLLIFPDGNSEYLKQYDPTTNQEELNTNDENDKPITSQNYENNNSEQYSPTKESDSNGQLNIQTYLNDTEKYNFSRERESREYLNFHNSSNDTKEFNTYSKSTENLNNQKYENHPVQFDSNSESESINHTNKIIQEISKNIRNKIRRVIIRKRVPENKMALKENDDKEIIITERTLSRIHQNLYRRRPNETSFTRGRINKYNDHKIEKHYKTEDLSADFTNNSFSIINFNSTILKTEDNVNDNDTRKKNVSYLDNLRPITRRQANYKRNNQEKLTPNPVERHHINNKETEDYDEYNFENYESKKIIPKNQISQRTEEKQSDFTDTQTSVTLKDMRKLIGPALQRKTQHRTVGINQIMNKKIRTRPKINESQRNKTPNLAESYSTNKIMLVEKFLKNVLLKEFEKIKAETLERNQRISNKILNKRLRNQKDNDNLQLNQERLNTGVKESVLNNASIQNARSEDFRRHRTNIKNNYNTNHEINNEEEAKSNIQRRLNEERSSGSNRKQSTDTIDKGDSTTSNDMFNETYDGTDLTDSGSEIHEQKIYPAPSAKPNNSENCYKQDTSRPPLIIGVIPRRIGRENLTYDIDETKEKQVRYPAPIEKSDNTDYQNLRTEYGIPDIKTIERVSDEQTKINENVNQNTDEKGHSDKQTKINENVNQNTDEKEHSDKQTKINENVTQNDVIIKKENLSTITAYCAPLNMNECNPYYTYRGASAPDAMKIHMLQVNKKDPTNE